MLKVLKFGGSSMASAAQYAKVKAIVEADESRSVVVVSAAGKRSGDDHKITDLLYLCHAHMRYGVSCDSVFGMISQRYLEIRDDLGLKTDLEGELAKIRTAMDDGLSEAALVSRGEYLSAVLMADYLGFDFVDATSWLFFPTAGRRTAASTPSPGAAPISPARWPLRPWTPTFMRTGPTYPAS